MRSSEIRLRKLKLRLRDKRFANHKAPCIAIWPATASVDLGSSELLCHGFNFLINADLSSFRFNLSFYLTLEISQINVIELSSEALILNIQLFLKP